MFVARLVQDLDPGFSGCATVGAVRTIVRFFFGRMRIRVHHEMVIQYVRLLIKAGPFQD